MSKMLSSHFAEYDLAQWLSYIESIHATEIDLGLDRISQVLTRLAVDFSFANVITVAGTNGKGTTCAFLENALLHNKLTNEKNTVAVYSSPHIERFNERLRINKQEVNDQELIDAFSQVELARAEISLSYYEFTTLAAFVVLMAVKPQVIILEVGLGGRLDATNVIEPDISVITTVDLDHQAFLGNTRELIGREKAGIMRTNKPVVVGELDIPVSVTNYAQEIGANLYARKQAFDLVYDAGTSADAETWQWQTNYPNKKQGEQQELEKLVLPNIPIDNVATALQVLNLLDYPLNSDSVNTLITATKVAGRTEVFKLGCDVMLDVGHNPQAARYLKNVVTNAGYNKIIAVVGMMKDKDIHATYQEIASVIDTWCFASLDMPRAANAQELQSSLLLTDKPVSLKSNVETNCFDNVIDAFKMAQQLAGKNDLVLVFGSFFTVAPVRKALTENI